MKPDDPLDPALSERNPYLEGHDSPWFKRAPLPQPPPTVQVVVPEHTRGRAGIVGWLTLVVTVLGLAVAAAAYFNQRAATRRQIELLEKQIKDAYDANRDVIERARAIEKIWQGQKELDVLNERESIKRSHQQPNMPMGEPQSKRRDEQEQRGIAGAALVDRVARAELTGIKKGLRAIQEAVEDVRESLPQSARVDEVALRRYRIRLTGSWSDEERGDLKRRWAAACDINVSSIQQVRGGYQFESPGCQDGTFDDLMKTGPDSGTENATIPRSVGR